ncbi:MAG: hypothetical protein A2W01_11205 [Candidatus Solincola sediminis]|nr:MAG: hypothetical protein A2W01_11205 [Candidatus Solincola sediminis]
MALTFTQKQRYSVGGHAYRLYEITHDGAATTINASDIDLNHINVGIPHTTAVLSNVADMDRLSGDTSGTFVTLVVNSAGATLMFEAWGW